MSEARYIHCNDCLEEAPEGTAPNEYARIGVAASPAGDLIVECSRHERLMAFIPNDEVAEFLFALGSAKCGCGRHDCDGETEGVN